MFVVVWLIKLALILIGLAVGLGGLALVFFLPSGTIHLPEFQVGDIRFSEGSYAYGALLGAFGLAVFAGGVAIPASAPKEKTSSAPPIDKKYLDFIEQLYEATKQLPAEQRDALIEEMRAVRESKDPRQQQAADKLMSDAPEQSFAALFGMAKERRTAGDIPGAIDLYLSAAAFATLTAPREAVLAYEEALSLKPGQFAPAFQLVFLKIEEGDIVAAQRYAEDALAAASDDNDRVNAKLAMAQVKLQMGDGETAVPLLRDCAKKLGVMLDEQPGDEQLERRLGEALQRLGNAQAAAGDLAAARKSYEQSYAYRLKLTEKPHQDGQIDRELIYALDAMASVLSESGDLEQALLYARISEERATALAQANPKHDDVKREALVVADRHAALLRQSGDLHAALQRLLASKAGYRDLAARAPSKLLYQQDLKNSFLTLSEAREQSGDLETAVEDARSAMKIAETLKRNAPSDVMTHLQEINARRWLAGIESRAGNIAEARQQIERALTDAKQVSVAAAEDLIANILATRAGLLLQAGDIKGASADFQGAIDIASAMHQRNPSAFFYELQAVACRVELAELKAQTGEMEEATRMFDGCIAAADQIAHANPRSIDAKRNAASVRYRVGARLSSSGDARGAVRALADAHTRYEALAKLNPRDVVDKTSLGWVCVSLCEALRVIGKIDEAALFAQSAMQISEQLTLADPINIDAQSMHARAFESLACVDSSYGRLSEQFKQFQRALKIYADIAKREGGGLPAKRNLAAGHSSIAHSLSMLGRFQEAEEHGRAALALQEEAHQRMQVWETAVDVIDANAKLADWFDAPSTKDKARAAIDAAVPMAREWAAKFPAIAQVRACLGRTLAFAGHIYVTNQRFAEARAYYDEALQILRELMRSDPGNAYLGQDAAATITGIGECAYQAKDVDTARSAYEEAGQAFRALAQGDPNDFWNHFSLLQPEFRLAQIAGDEAKQKEIARRFDELQKGEGRDRVFLHHRWAADVRALIAAGA